jgi:speckle-type POZ protein
MAGETVAGSHVRTIDGYAETKEALGVGGSVESDLFRVGGHNWCIQCYPCGEDEEVAGWVSVYLCLALDRHGAEHDEAVEARFQFVLLDRAGKAVHTAPISVVHTFSRTDDSWGAGKFIRITELASTARKQGIRPGTCTLVRY